METDIQSKKDREDAKDKDKDGCGSYEQVARQVFSNFPPFAAGKKSFERAYIFS